MYQNEKPASQEQFSKCNFSYDCKNDELDMLVNVSYLKHITHLMYNSIVLVLRLEQMKTTVYLLYNSVAEGT